MTGQNHIIRNERLDRVKRALQHFRVIYIRRLVTNLIKDLRQGAAAYVTKPIEPEVLQSAITDAVAA